MAKKNALGRGLNALIESGDNDKFNKTREPNEIKIDLIEANPFQPRSNFDEEALNELADSIKELGLIQPITVRALENGKYQLISGERRLRASKIVGLEKVPAYIRSTDDQGMLEMALVENIQREDLNAIEVAISYQRLMDECNLTQDMLSQRVGKKRSTVANYTRLLNLPAKIQLGLKEDKITMGHARALLSIKDSETQIMVYDQILKYDFSVRRVEDIVKELANDAKPKKTSTTKTTIAEKDYLQLQNHLSSCFATKVEFKRSAKGNGKIVIPFKNDYDLERIIALLDKLNV
ncbi:MAG: ParB/RepB/Spo0J family partition protein [Bacteroidales bacterium]|jgi:ParB family chromosome partitioning protein|nr:ParB/RepB/Spo0J family partition protein [Bacteroidales bacterium]MCK9498387.1 ParB/RepB/Spo0J family partition protein [Bacteroidales bacterium]MDY0314187.1 ParB/RepB/Spo0J family partition protein [Bacteroidales bacterium]NLB86365.1 ParB/RepB/Spo0J family partition protein [Bacteroidales bacterium]